MSSVKIRLIGGFGLVIAVVVGSSLVIRSSLDQAEEAHHEAVDLSTAVEKAIRVEESLILQRALQAEYAITRDPQLLEVFEETASVAFGTMDELEAQFADNPEIQDIAAELERLDVEHDAIVFDEMVPAFAVGDEAGGYAALARAQVVLDELLVVVARSTDTFHEELDAQNAATSENVEGAEDVLLLSAVGMVSITVLVVAWNMVTILRPVKTLTRAAQRLSRGDVSEPVTLGSRDEFGVLARAFSDVTSYVHEAAQVTESLASGDLSQHIEPHGPQDQLGRGVRHLTTSLREVMGDLSPAAASLSTASDELLTMSRELSTAAEATSTEATSISSASGHLSATMTDVVGQADEAATAAGDVVTTVGATTATVGQLAEAGTQIGAVIGSIQAIAEQTNLLALNATIEAARAGESGKGFAVVANEVKDLATQTSLATGEIESQIAEIQDNTQGAVTATEGVSTSIQDLYETANSIAQATREQASVTSNLRSNAEAIVEAASSTATVAQSTLDASSNLSEMAANMTSLISRFQLEPGTGRSPGLDPTTNASSADMERFDLDVQGVS